MILVIIRTCKKDDYLARLCYDSFKELGIKAKYIFLADNDNYKYINETGEQIIYKDWCDNYGATRGVNGFVKSLKKINLDFEHVIISDSDIVVLDDFINEIYGTDHFGTGGRDQLNNLLHISGQVQIFKGEIIKKISNLNDDQVQFYIDTMLQKNINIADDTFCSYLTDHWNCSKKIINNHKLWIHYKFYEYQNLDSKRALRIIKDKFFI
jgi:hypothetical protein